MTILNCIIIEGRFCSVLNTAVPNISLVELHKTHVLCKLAREGRAVKRIISSLPRLARETSLGTTEVRLTLKRDCGLGVQKESKGNPAGDLAGCCSYSGPPNCSKRAPYWRAGPSGLWLRLMFLPSRGGVSLVWDRIPALWTRILPCRLRVGVRLGFVLDLHLQQGICSSFMWQESSKKGCTPALTH